ncbi:GNAT family N-acetyltransferase [Polyangium aurulentum]|uniref:GNAT family N-acetyltransferase n=1 Tax=Polyangium aurulentum TaxID=2567896 RepID=UPI0010AE9E90|nr:GNAT family protein [Polyangium aurulentum]UQA58103.1 GNAT family N-acetyltransferase [Polyangium aurulentum]
MSFLPLETILSGERVALRAPRASDAKRLVEIRSRSRHFLAPWVSLPSADEFEIEPTRAQLLQERQWFRGDRHYKFVMTDGPNGEIIGRVSLSQVFRGVFQNAYLGYWIDVEHQGRGFTTEGVRLALGAAFGPLGLHRVQAAILPDNEASLAVASKVGLRLEGRAERYLQIAGVWRDHLIFAITAEEWTGRERRLR